VWGLIIGLEVLKPKDWLTGLYKSKKVELNQKTG
jgi:hypothetical protein